MEATLLKDQVLRSEGFSEGFKAGYLACASFVADQLKKEREKDNGTEAGQGQSSNP